MPLQNRVTPFGDVVALPGRGLVLGNRGILHDDHRRIVRPWQCRRWIACRREWRAVRRTPMRPHSWTELFFLDEAAAFAAGHRPCAYCRRDDYRRFRSMWERRFGGPAGADAMDAVLHEERLNGRTKRMYRANLAQLPDGTYLAIDDRALLVWGDSLFVWSDTGYSSQQRRPANAQVAVLTPPSIVALFADGYRPGIHPTATL